MSTIGAELVLAAQDDQPGALERLVDLSLPTVLGWCVRMSGPGIHAEDAAHDVFEVALDKLHTLRAPEAYVGWLYGITRRVLARHRRRAWIRRWIPGVSVDVVEDPAIGPFGAAAQSETARRVWAALRAMPDHHREVLVLCDLEERTNTEVAAMLGIPAPTVRSRLRRARARLRLEVADLAPPNALEVAAGGQ